MDALLVQVAAAIQSFSDILQTQHEADDLVPVSTATEILEDVQPIFTDDVISTVEQKIESAKKPGDKISWHDVLEILSFVLCLIALIRDVAQDVLPDKHEEFVENALSSIIEKWITEFLQKWKLTSIPRARVIVSIHPMIFSIFQKILQSVRA